MLCREGSGADHLCLSTPSSWTFTHASPITPSASWTDPAHPPTQLCYHEEGDGGSFSLGSATEGQLCPPSFQDAAASPWKQLLQRNWSTFCKMSHTTRKAYVTLQNKAIITPPPPPTSQCAKNIWHRKSQSVKINNGARFTANKRTSRSSSTWPSQLSLAYYGLPEGVKKTSK